MNEYMKRAIDEARIGIHAGHGGPFGSVIVRGGKVIGAGHNEVVLRHDPTCHGEMMAIRDACAKEGTFDLSDCEIYTTAEPCPMCLGAIYWANIKKVYYGCNTIDTDSIGFRDEVFYENLRGDKSEFVEELDRAYCQELFAEYASIEGKTHY